LLSIFLPIYLYIWDLFLTKLVTKVKAYTKSVEVHPQQASSSGWCGHGCWFIVARILDIKHTVFQVYSTDRGMKLKFPSAQKGTFWKRHLFFFFFAPSIPASFRLYSHVGLKLSQECHAPGWGFTTLTLGESPMGRFSAGWKFSHYHPCKMVQNYSCISFLMSAQFPHKMGVMKSLEWWNFALNSLHTQHV